MTPGDAAARDLLGRTWDEVEADAAAYITRAEAEVVRWAWVGPDADLWEQREPVTGVETPLREVAEPDDAARCRFALLGWDAAGEIVVGRRFTDHWEGRDGGTQLGVVFVERVWIDGIVLSFTHERHGRSHHRVRLSGIGRQEHRDGRVVEHRSWGRESSSRRHFDWADDQVVAVVRESHDARGAPAERTRLTYEHDGDGLLRARWTVEVHPNAEVVGDTGIFWFRRSPAALRAARALVDCELPERIRAWAARVAPDEPVFGLGIMWCYEAPDFPPSLGLGAVAELRAWGGDPYRIWNPAEYACFDPLPAELTGGEFEDACALLRQDWELSETDREPAQTLRRAAKRLLDVDWGAVVNPGDDFAVFVVADELLDSLTRDLRKTVPADVQRRIERS